MTAKEFLIERKVYFEEDNLVEVPSFILEVWLQQYARVKCLEAIKNTRHKACEIVQARENNLWDCDRILYNCEREIHNIPNEDVMPEL